MGEISNIVGFRCVPQQDAEIKKYLKKRCPMNQMTVMIRKSEIEAVGGYLDWFCNEDYYLWIRIALAGKMFANIENVLVNVRVGEEMYKRRGGIKYFMSERKLQRYMLQNKLIGIPTYIDNIIKRFIIQVLLPSKVRGLAFMFFARKRHI